MPTRAASRMPRRDFLGTACLLGGTMLHRLSGSPVMAQDRRPVPSDPRATDGDDRFEPAWDERLTITVGPSKADITGTSDKAVQAALDYVVRLGGGTVKLLPGTYVFRNAVFLPSRTRLLGSGPDSIITRDASRTVELAADSDWYDQEITLKDAAGFQVGDGITLRTRNPHNGSEDIIKATLVARSGNRFKLHDGLRKNLWLSGTPTCSTLFPLLTSEHTSDVTIEHVTLDGNKENVTNLDGNHAGCIFLQDCTRYTLKNIEARNYNGDGISFQICHDVHVDHCHCHDNAGLGLHPGSGSQRPLIRNCRLERNTIGLFWCWGVKYGLAEHNHIVGNSSYGISIGHNDTDNIMRHNAVIDSGSVGILFRDDSRGADFWANRNVVEQNRIVNSGDADGVAIDIQGRTRDITLSRNEVLENRGPERRTGIRMGSDVGHVMLADNQITGFAHDIADLRTA